MSKKKLSKLLALYLPYVVIGLLATNLGEAWRLAVDKELGDKIVSLMDTLPAAFSNPQPSLHPFDLFIGLCCGAGMRLAVYLKGKNAKKYRHGMEYGSARWGGPKDIEPFMAPKFEDNIILTKTEHLMMSNRPPDPKNARNKNVLVVGGSGSGKTRFWLKPNLLQCHSSYVVTDPKGSIVVECGNALLKNGYKLKILNTINFKKSIELFPKNWQQHNYLSLGGVSAKALQQFLSERPDMERVFLCLDADKAGEDACKRLAALLPDTVSVTRIQPTRKDWNEVLVHRAEIPNRDYFKSTVLKEPPKKDSVKIIRMSDVELTPVDWLWKPYLPFGKLSVLQGNPGEGKTYFAMHLAAACTNGKLMPNMERLEPFNVIYQTAEDGLGDTVKPRLIEAGADLDRVLVIDDSDVQLTLSDERIEKAIIENNARLVIIDPIQAYLGADVDMNRANEVRPIFMRLGQVAQRTGCAILLIGHLNKAAGMQSLQRGLGSIDIAAAVRSVMFIGKLKHDPTMRILTHEKSSLAPPGMSLAFSLGDEGGFRWVGEYDITADEMLSGIEPQRETKTQQAKDLICTLLAGGKQVLSEDIDKAALERGIPGRTVRDAKRELGDALKSKIVEGRKKVFWME